MKTLKEKCVSYAYPTSDIAEAFGKREGVWYVQWEDNKARIEIFNTRKEASAFADALPLPYSRFSWPDIVKRHPKEFE